MTQQKMKIKKFLILTAIILIGFSLRLYDLNSESLWRDEVFSVNTAKQPIIEIFNIQDTNPPLYYIILHLWINFIGDSDFTLRMLSVILGVLALFMIYKVGKQLFDDQIGLLSSLVLGIATFQIHYSQEVRTYSLTVLLTLISVYFYIKLLDKNRVVDYILYIISGSLLTYSHVYGFFILLAQNFHFIFCKYTGTDVEVTYRRWIFGQIFIFVLFLPWISVFISQTSLVVKKGFWISQPGLKDIRNTIRGFTGHAIVFWLSFPLLILSLFSVKKISGNFDFRSIKDSIEEFRWEIKLEYFSKIAFLLMWLIIPIIVPFLISHITSPIYLDRYAIVASLPLYILIAKGVANLENKYLKNTILALIVIASFSNTWSTYYQKIHREQWKDTANYIDERYHKGDIVIFSTDGSIDAFNYYSKNKKMNKIALIETDGLSAASRLNDLALIVNDYERVWAVLNNFRKKENNTIKAKLCEGFSLSNSSKYVGIDVYLYDKKI